MAPEPDEAWTSVSRGWLYAGVLLLTAFVFGSTLRFGFVYDDHWTLLGNGFLRTRGDLHLLLSDKASARHIPDAFRPTSVLFDLASYRLAGVSSMAHHAFSVGLHVLVTGCFGFWLRQQGAPRRLVVASMTLFGVLAIHAEAVAVVSYREDLLASALGLMAVSVASRTARSRATAIVAGLASGVLMVLACGAKLSVAGLPIVWLLAVRLKPWGDPMPWRRCLPKAACLATGVAFALAFRVHIFGGVSPYGDSSRILAVQKGLGAVLAASTQIHLGYLQQVFVPRGFSPEYVDFVAAWTEPATLCASGAILGLLGVSLAAARMRRAPLLAWVILAALALALPTSNLAPMPNMRADRLMYLTSAPLCVGMASALLRAGDVMAQRFGINALAPWIAMVVLQGSMAQGVAAAYRSDTRLWEIALRRAPDSARAHAIFGELMVAQLNRAVDPNDEPALLIRARTHCARALAIEPTSDLPHLCAARLAAAQKFWVQAHHAFEVAFERAGVRRDRAMVALASTALDLPTLTYDERVRRAFSWLARAKQEYPYIAEVYAISARLRHRLGDAAGATEDYRRARALHPERWDLVIAGLELELDLGHASAAAKSWAEAQTVLEPAPSDRIQSFQRRLNTAQRLDRPQP